MTLAAPSSSGRPWLSEDICRGSTRYKGSYGWLKFSSMMLALISLYGEWAVLPLKRSLRTNQWSPADARSHKFRAARRDAAPASSDAPAAASLASWLTSIFTCAPGVRGPIARRSAVREIIRGRVGTAVTAERTAGASAGEPSRRRRVSGESPAPPRHRADVAQRSTHTHTLTLPSHRNPRMRSNAPTSSRPSATRRARCKCSMTSSRRRRAGPGSRSSRALC